MKPLKLQAKMTITISVIIILLILVMSCTVFTYIERQLKENISQQQLLLAHVMTTEIDNKLQVAQNLLSTTSTLIPRKDFNKPEKLQEFLESSVSLINFFDNHIFIFSPDGTLLAETPFENDRRGSDFSYRDYIKNTVETRKPYISNAYQSNQQHGHPAIMCTVPVFDNKGKMVLILAGGIDLMKENFLGDLSRITVGETGYVYLYDMNRTIIMHPDRDRILVNDVPVGSNILFDKAINGFEGTEETLNSRGVQVLTTFKHIPSNNWILGINYPISEAYAPIAKAGKFLFFVTLIGIVIAVISSKTIVRNLTTPLLFFTKHVQDVNSKVGNQRLISLNTGDEINDLSQAFNSMIEEVDLKNDILKKSEEIYRVVTEHSTEVSFWRSPDGEIRYIAPNCKRLTGYEDVEFYDNPNLLDQMVYYEDKKVWEQYQSEETSYYFEKSKFRIISKLGDLYWVSHSYSKVYSDAGEYLGIRGSLLDVTALVKAQEKLKYLTFHDSLTGLFNRVYFEQKLKKLDENKSLHVGMIVCDVDGLKFINDSLGHDKGDELLIAAADVLKQSIQDGMEAARIGGDEFIIFLQNSDKEAVKNSYHQIRQNMVQYNQEHPERLLSMSMGFAISDVTSKCMKDIFTEADDNMYREKLCRQSSTRNAILQTLNRTIEIRDFVNEGHAARMQDLATELGNSIGLSENNISKLRLFAKYHDIGKINIPDEIIFKPGRFTKEERLIMQRHCEVGYRIANAMPKLVVIADWILKHHEWWNGTGYPLGLRGKQIPVECRILAIADAYDAMTSDRPYRRAMSEEAAIAEIKCGAGVQFDAELVEIFIKLHNKV